MKKGSLHSILVPFILSKLVFGMIVCLVSLFSFNIVPAREIVNYDLKLVADLNIFLQNLKFILLSADGFWYLDIAKNGYQKEIFGVEYARNWVYFPLFPILVAGISKVFGQVLLSSILLNSALFLLGLFYFRRIASHLGYTENESARSIWLLCFFPSGVFFNTPVSESLFFALLIGVFYSLYSGRIILSGFLMCLLGLSRPTGMILYPIFIIALIELGYFNKKNLWSVLTVAICAPVGTICFSLYLKLITGNPLAFIENQIMWGRETNIIEGFVSVFNEICDLGIKPWNIPLLNLLFILVAFIAALPFLKKNNIHLFLLILVPPLVSASSGSIMFSGRYILPLFPIYLSLSRFITNELLEKAVLVMFGVMYALFTLGFALHVTAFMA